MSTWTKPDHIVVLQYHDRNAVGTRDSLLLRHFCATGVNMTLYERLSLLLATILGRADRCGKLEVILETSKDSSRSHDKLSIS